MHILRATRHAPEERLLWSRDIRFVHRLATTLTVARLLELETGTVLVAPSDILTEGAVADVAEAAAATDAPEFGLVAVDSTLPERDRYLVALSAAVQLSGIAARIGMAQSTQVVQTKMLDYFFSLRNMHRVAFQPIVALACGGLHEYECLFRPEMPMLPQSIGSVVQAAINTGRGVELDMYIISTVLERIGRLEAEGRAVQGEPRHFALNLTPASILDPAFEVTSLIEQVRGVGLEPHRITIECTEQQAVTDVVLLQRKTKALRRAGFGVSVDDAGAGYASFALIAALRPTFIKIDRDIVTGIGHDEAKQALVEAFVSFGRRIGARLIAEGIERRVDLATLTRLGVEFGQGYLLGKPAPIPSAPRRIDRLRLEAPARPARVPSRA